MNGKSNEIESDPNAIITARCHQCHEWLATDASVGGCKLLRVSGGPRNEVVYRPLWLCIKCRAADAPALTWIERGHGRFGK